MSDHPPEFIDWLLERVVVCPSGCWIWTGADSGQEGRGANYQKGRFGNGTEYVHRAVHRVCIGPIPPGKQVDHKCKHWSKTFAFAHRRCVNPDHLEAVTQTENIKRNHKKQELDRDQLLLNLEQRSARRERALVAQPSERKAGGQEQE